MSDDNEDLTIEFLSGILFVQITSFLVFEEAPPIVLICIGLDSGEICCIRGDIARNRVTRLRLSVDPAVDGGQPASPVTGLGFRVEGQMLQLFAVTTSSINLFDMHDSSPQKKVIDQIGTEGRCVAMSDNQVSHDSNSCVWRVNAVDVL